SVIISPDAPFPLYQKSDRFMRTIVSSPNGDPRDWARMCMAFAIAALASCSIEMLLWRAHSVLAFIFPFAAYMLGSLRIFPKKTLTRASSSHGFVLGSLLPVLLYLAVLSFW